uniref:CRN3 n=1 Tax=Albugo laibachii Nc14 TaxID=890382 RepID=F0WQ97_9STRA|nr:CRN3 [Albugo laibachii Nc14]|eukprot:CCA23503.1 CRN3 [Albugo laibachii Nc14]
MMLFCVLTGIPGSAFPVDIDNDLSVGHLKEEIKKKNKRTIQCDARELKLYPANRNGAWLVDASDDVQLLRNGETSHVQDLLGEELSSVRILDKIFTNLNRDDEVNHVLVVVPKQSDRNIGEHSEPSKTMEELYYVKSKLGHADAPSKRKRYTHSQMSSKKGRMLLQDMKLRKESAHIIIPDTDTAIDVEAFDWAKVAIVDGKEISLTEEQLRAIY